MLKRIVFRWFQWPVAVLAVAVFSPFTVSAQEEVQLAGVSVRIVSVKADSVAQWEAGVRDLAASLADQGLPFFHVYERLRGDNLPSYTIINQDEYFGDVPQAEIDQQILSRILQASNGSDLYTIQTYEQLGIAPESLAPSAPYLRTRVRVTSPSDAQAYMDWQEDMVDTLREIGITDLRVGRIVLGGNSNSWVRWTYQDSISGNSAVDVEGTVGQRELDRMIAEGNALVTTAEDYVLMFRPDLSIVGDF